MRVPRIMGCGRSKSASNAAGDAPDADNNGHIHAHPEKKKSLIVSTPEDEVRSAESGLPNGSLPFNPSDSVQNADRNANKSALKDRTYSGPLNSQSQITASQIDFFRMLDAKIEQGNDYIPEDEST